MTQTSGAAVRTSWTGTGTSYCVGGEMLISGHHGLNRHNKHLRRYREDPADQPAIVPRESDTSRPDISGGVWEGLTQLISAGDGLGGLVSGEGFGPPSALPVVCSGPCRGA